MSQQKKIKKEGIKDSKQPLLYYDDPDESITTWIVTMGIASFIGAILAIVMHILER